MEIMSTIIQSFDFLVLQEAWSLEALESNARSFLTLIISLLIGWMALTSYGKGQKGRALVEVLVGVVIAIFILDAEAIEALSNGVKKLLGFGE